MAAASMRSPREPAGARWRAAPAPEEHGRVAEAHACSLAVVVPAAPRVVARVVDRVDDGRLARVGSAREREVRVASELVETAQLVVHPAPAAVGAPVRERPVPMDEGPRGTSCVVTRDHAMRRERRKRPLELLAQRGARVPVVMQMHLDLAQPGSTSPASGSSKRPSYSSPG